VLWQFDSEGFKRLLCHHPLQFKCGGNYLDNVRFAHSPRPRGRANRVDAVGEQECDIGASPKLRGQLSEFVEISVEIACKKVSQDKLASIGKPHRLQFRCA